ncbi:MAG: sigma-70 family RNA polymerase sigma factor [Peptococcaceae bacterium]|nr:sigma-70 family RNA polymerase sigma factor [Candidatus Syntrophopropionicum ammoniitolerans]
MDDTVLLVERAQNNDMAAFEELVRIYQNRVYALCVHLTSNGADAQDIAQEAFIRAYRYLGSFRQQADFGTWLHRITVNVWLNFRRKNKKIMTLSLDEPYVDGDGGELQREMASPKGDPLQALEKKEFRGLVRIALDELSPEHRAVLVLREIEDYSYEEIARMLGCSLGTVKSRLSRARRAMRDRMIDLAREAGVNLPVE